MIPSRKEEVEVEVEEEEGGEEGVVSLSVGRAAARVEEEEEEEGREEGSPPPLVMGSTPSFVSLSSFASIVGRPSFSSFFPAPPPSFPPFFTMDPLSTRGLLPAMTRPTPP